MRKIEKTQYHCCFLLDKKSSMLNMAIAWKRVGAQDYGIYLTRKQGQEDLSPLCTWFKASYSSQGKVIAFHVKDGLVKEGADWDEDHIKMGSQPTLIDTNDMGHIEKLASSFLGQWLESFGKTEALLVLKKIGLTGFVDKSTWHSVLRSGLPVEIKRGRLPDVLSCAEYTEHGFLYAFMPYPERLGHTDSTHALLEAKMHMFFELL